MSQLEVIGIVQETVYTILIMSLPLLSVGLIVGVIVSIFQATTQINEQSLSFIPKLVVVFLTFAFSLPWMLQTMMDYTNRLYSRINTFLQ